MKDLILFPSPKRLEFTGPGLSLPSAISYLCTDAEMLCGIEPWADVLNLQQVGDEKASLLKVIKGKTGHLEGYKLVISESQIELEAESPVGAFRGFCALEQLVSQAEDGKLQGVRVEDQPSMNRRGFMLDVSRCKVPRMDELFRLIELIARLAYNELQLYIEHTFAFSKHETVWQDASPFTAEEIRKIDEFCAGRFIELVPNLNSFGHFERWLQHVEYRHLAECPDGFIREQPYIKRDHGTTLKPNAKSLEFIDSLYEEYLPNFTSNNFNVGMDEPWELGQGWSREEVGKNGKDKVYLRHLDGIRKLVEKHGKRMQFWADVLLEKPENAKLLCPSASPIIWGYEPGHPFDEQAGAIAACGLDFCLAPGVGSWRSFTGRWPVAQKNLSSAYRYAQKHGATGMLITSWGDCGNHQPWPTVYPGLLHGASLAWAGEELAEDKLSNAIDRLVYQAPGAGLGKAILELGKVDDKIGVNLPNTCLDWWILFAARAELLRDALPGKVMVEQINQGLAHLKEASSLLPHACDNLAIEQSVEEMRWGAEISAWCLGQGKRILLEEEATEVTETEVRVKRFSENWLKRARTGGLEESSTLLREGIIALSKE